MTGGRLTLADVESAVSIRSAFQLKAISKVLPESPMMYYGCSREARGHWMTNDLRLCDARIAKLEVELIEARIQRGKAVAKLASEFKYWGEQELLAAFTSGGAT